MFPSYTLLTDVFLQVSHTRPAAQGAAHPTPVSGTPLLAPHHLPHHLHHLLPPPDRTQQTFHLRLHPLLLHPHHLEERVTAAMAFLLDAVHLEMWGDCGNKPVTIRNSCLW